MVDLMMLKTRMLIGAAMALLLAGERLHAQAVPPQPPKAPAAAAQPSKAPSGVKLKWMKGAPLPVGVFDAAGTLVGPRTFVVTGGLWQSGLANDGVQAYDIAADKWSLPAKLTTPRFNHAQVTLDDHRILVVGGQATKEIAKGIPTFSAEIVDIKAGTSEKLADAPESKPLRAPAACEMGSWVVIVGADRVYRFDKKTGLWLASIKLNHARAFCAIVPLDDTRLLIVGGEGRDSLELVDLEKGQSRLLGEKLPMAIDDLQAIKLHDGRVWIFGGQDAKTGDTTEKSWFFAVDTPGAKLVDGPVLGVKNGVADHRVATALPYVFIVGGESQLKGEDTELKGVRLFDVRTLTVRQGTALPQPCDDALAFEYAGRVYVVGGYFIGPSTFGGVRLPRASGEVFWCQAPEE
jgi:hypothetical protein